MSELGDGCIDHLVAALEETEPSEKNYHIREVLQTCETDGLAEDMTVELAPMTEEQE
jgi:hypothetical protein